MECILLGTGGMMPMPYRLLASMAVRLKGQIYVFDAGEGTQLGWKKVRLGVRGLRLFAVTHLHADHCLGLPGLMMLRAQMDHPEPLTILGPPGIEAFVRRNQEILHFYLNYPVRFVEWSSQLTGPAYEDDLVRILWEPLDHTRFCLGYRLEELERPGKFDPARARNLGVPEGPLWGRLQRGGRVAVDGGVVSPEQVVGPPRRGRHVAYVVDTRPTESIGRLCRRADLAFIEGMFLPEDDRQAFEKGHMTVLEAAGLAAEAGVRRAVLTHISPRYENSALDTLERVARERFDDVRVGRDLDTYVVPYPD